MSTVSPAGFVAVVHGHVQGVGFRWSTRRLARELDVVGTVQNLPDGTVKVIAEGGEASLQALNDWLHSGPAAARVTRVTVSWQEPPGRYRDFDIV